MVAEDNRLKKPDQEEENWKDKGALQAYGYLAKRTAETDLLKMLDWSWFTAQWKGAPRWKWIIRGIVALMLTGPTIALFGFLFLGWYR
jgi:hypothetical protein